MDVRGIRVLPQKKEGTPMRKVTAQRLAEFTERAYVLTFGVGKREFDRNAQQCTLNFEPKNSKMKLYVS